MIKFEVKIGEQDELKTIAIELDDSTPITRDNFLAYCRDGFYQDTIFHRVIPGFMVQGGGFSADMMQKETEETIENEAEFGQSNLRGTLAMARTGEPHSATAQFFMNLSDNTFLDQAQSQDGWGYCVFGKITDDSLEVIDEIAKVSTGSQAGHQDVPEEPIVIVNVVLEEGEVKPSGDDEVEAENAENTLKNDSIDLDAIEEKEST